MLFGVSEDVALHTGKIRSGIHERNGQYLAYYNYVLCYVCYVLISFFSIMNITELQKG